MISEMLGVFTYLLVGRLTLAILFDDFIDEEQFKNKILRKVWEYIVLILWPLALLPIVTGVIAWAVMKRKLLENKLEKWKSKFDF